MSAATELERIARELKEIHDRAQLLADGSYLVRFGDYADFKRLSLEAKHFIDGELGALNAFSSTFLSSSPNSLNIHGGPTLARVMEVQKIVEGATNVIRLRESDDSKNSSLLPNPKTLVTALMNVGPTAAATAQQFVHADRINELEALSSHDYDFKRLVRLCEELNITYREECYQAATVLVRAIMDHVPPVFGFKEFKEVAARYGGKSIKGTFQHLQQSSRNLSDGALHQIIRKVESLPTETQVRAFQGDLDKLLEEVVRVTREAQKTAAPRKAPP